MGWTYTSQSPIRRVNLSESGKRRRLFQHPKSRNPLLVGSTFRRQKPGWAKARPQLEVAIPYSSGQPFGVCRNRHLDCCCFQVAIPYWSGQPFGD